MMAGYISLAMRRRVGQMAELLPVVHFGAAGDNKAYKKLLKNLVDESQ